MCAQPVRIPGAITVALMILCLAGCGSGSDEWAAKRPTPVPAGGAVLHKGQPVSDATVLFVPEGHKHAAIGRTDADGKFKLQTFEQDDGAVPGDFKVTVRKVEVIAAAGDPEEDDAELPPPEERSLLPESYGNAALSGLTASVKEGGENNFTFELTDGPAGGGTAGAKRAPVTRGE